MNLATTEAFMNYQSQLGKQPSELGGPSWYSSLRSVLELRFLMVWPWLFTSTIGGGTWTGVVGVFERGGLTFTQP
jgi:hypothetical protein